MTSEKAQPAAPIGIFDSGVGGLSVLQAIRDLLPAERLIYVADSANAPYGERDSEFVTARAHQITDFLLSLGAKLIVVACNTATAASIAALRSASTVPLVGVEPAIKPAASITRSGKVGVLATTRTVQSPSLQRLVRTHRGDAEFILQACSGLADAIESGASETEATARMLHGFTQPLLDAGADVIVLGCTHYSFIVGPLEQIVADRAQIIDTAPAIARRVAQVLTEHELLAAQTDASPDTQYFSSAPAASADALFSQLLLRPVTTHRFE